MIYLGDVRKLEPRTINDRRGRLNRFWRWLADKEFLRRRPTNDPLPVPEKDPEAWSQDQLQALIQACALEPGSQGGLPASVFWLAFHAMAWDSGARTMEILYGFFWERLDWQTGWIRVPADVRKGRMKPARYRFLPDVLTLLATFRQPTGLILGWSKCESRFYQLYAKLLSKAGLPSTRWDKPQKIRRSHATWLEWAGGDATVSLLHSSRSVTRKSYLDPNILAGPGHSTQLPFRVLDFAPRPIDEPLEVIALPHDPTEPFPTEELSQ
jgi:integrase